MSDGAELIAAERLRQVTAEGWTPEDIAQRDAERTAEAQEAADRAEFEAWRASREATR